MSSFLVQLDRKDLLPQIRDNGKSIRRQLCFRWIRSMSNRYSLNLWFLTSEAWRPTFINVVQGAGFAISFSLISFLLQGTKRGKNFPPLEICNVLLATTTNTTTTTTTTTTSSSATITATTSTSTSITTTSTSSATTTFTSTSTTTTATSTSSTSSTTTTTESKTLNFEFFA